MASDPGKRTGFDCWLAGICASRVFNGLVFMTYAGALFVLRLEWGMPAAQAGAVAPLAFGAVLDWSNPAGDGQQLYSAWRWAFGVLGLGGLGAVWAIHRFRKIPE